MSDFEAATGKEIVSRKPRRGLVPPDVAGKARLFARVSWIVLQGTCEAARHPRARREKNLTNLCPLGAERAAGIAPAIELLCGFEVGRHLVTQIAANPLKNKPRSRWRWKASRCRRDAGPLWRRDEERVVPPEEARESTQQGARRARWREQVLGKRRTRDPEKEEGEVDSDFELVAFSRRLRRPEQEDFEMLRYRSAGQPRRRWRLPPRRACRAGTLAASALALTAGADACSRGDRWFLTGNSRGDEGAVRLSEECYLCWPRRWALGSSRRRQSWCAGYPSVLRSHSPCGAYFPLEMRWQERRMHSLLSRGVDLLRTVWLRRLGDARLIAVSVLSAAEGPVGGSWGDARLWARSGATACGDRARLRRLHYAPRRSSMCGSEEVDAAWVGLSGRLSV